MSSANIIIECPFPIRVIFANFVNGSVVSVTFFRLYTTRINVMLHWGVIVYGDWIPYYTHFTQGCLATQCLDKTSSFERYRFIAAAISYTWCTDNLHYLSNCASTTSKNQIVLFSHNVNMFFGELIDKIPEACRWPVTKPLRKNVHILSDYEMELQ